MASIRSTKDAPVTDQAVTGTRAGSASDDQHNEDVVSVHTESQDCFNAADVNHKRLRDPGEQTHTSRSPKRQKPTTTGLYSTRERIQHWANSVSEPRIDHTMKRLLAKPKKPADLKGRKRSAPSSTGSLLPTDRLDRSCSYQDLGYRMLLEENGSFLSDSRHGLCPASIQQLIDLLSYTPTDVDPSLLDDRYFRAVVAGVEDRSETRITRDITPLLVPSVETMFFKGIIAEDYMVETLDEGWNSCYPLTSPRPQPDFAVGFKRKAFTKEELEILLPYVGSSFSKSQSYFLATYLMCFPFLTCEAKCEAAGLDVADRQNAHSMTVAVRSVMELFRAAQCLGDVQREILGFSFSHDAQSIRMYAHYFDVVDEAVQYYRHKIRSFDFTELNGKDKQTAYNFVRGVYSSWAPVHLARVKAAIMQLPKLSEEVEDSALPSHITSQSVVSQSNLETFSEVDVSPGSSASEYASCSAKRAKN